MPAPRLLLLNTTACALLLSGCGGALQGPPASTASVDTSPAAALATPPKSAPVRIALLLPLAGFSEPAHVARGMKQAAEMALFDANNPSVQLIVKDDGGTAEGARLAAQAAITEGAELILGPLFGKAASGAASVAGPAQIPVLTFSNDPAVAGNGVYLMSFLAADEVNRVIAYAASRGKRRFAALIPATPYGQAVDPAFRKAIADAKAEIVVAETYRPDASGILDSAKRVLAVIEEAESTGQPVDALFLPSGPDEIAQLAPLLAYAGLDTKKVKLVGTSAWDIPGALRDDIMLGGWYAASDPQAWTDFSQKFQKAFGTAPPRLASLAYDATALAITLAGTPPPARYSAASLRRQEGFAGVDGNVRFTPQGRAERGLALLEIEKYRSVVLDPAPSADAVRMSSAAN